MVMIAVAVLCTLALTWAKELEHEKLNAWMKQVDPTWQTGVKDTSPGSNLAPTRHCQKQYKEDSCSKAEFVGSCFNFCIFKGDKIDVPCTDVMGDGFCKSKGGSDPLKFMMSQKKQHLKFKTQMNLLLAGCYNIMTCGDVLDQATSGRPTPTPTRPTFPPPTPTTQPPRRTTEPPAPTEPTTIRPRLMTLPPSQMFTETPETTTWTPPPTQRITKRPNYVTIQPNTQSTFRPRPTARPRPTGTRQPVTVQWTDQPPVIGGGNAFVTEPPRPVIFMPLLPRMPWWSEADGQEPNQPQTTVGELNNQETPLQQMPGRFDPGRWFNFIHQIQG